MEWGGVPDEEKVQQLIELLGGAIERPEAIARLKGNNDDVERALNEYFDPGTQPDKYKWDDSVWSADRDGNANSAGVQFNVQGPDVTASHFDSSSAAPTRPPSRTTNRSPLGAPTTHADEDADLQRALAESAAESGLPPQESGIIGGDITETKFGPATRSEYDQDQWAMVPTKEHPTTQQKQELLPSGRKRALGAPSFLRANKDHRLAAVVTILSHIPLARNSLLSCGPPARSYGYNNEWWQGKAIVKQENLDAVTQDDWTTPSQCYPDFYDELHRLLAFLDGTDRAFGSIEGLTDTSAIDPNHGYGYGTIDYEERFFEVLKTEYEDSGNVELKPLMGLARTERALKIAPDSEASPEDQDDTALNQSSDNDTGDEAIFNFLTIPLQEGQSQGVTTLYDALDTIFWSDAFSTDAFPTESSNVAFIDEIGEFFLVRFGGSGLCKPCDIPVNFYADRYMKNRKDQALTIQTQIHILRSSLGKTESWEKAVLTCSGETGCRERKWYDEKPHSARDCWARTIEVCHVLIEKQRRMAQLRRTQEALTEGRTPSMKGIALIYSGNSPFELSSEEQELRTTLERGADLAKKKLSEIDLDLERIKERRQQIIEALDHLSMRLTVREEEAPQDFVDKYIVPGQSQFYSPEYWNPNHKYLLRGVATTNEITYVCTRRDADLIDFGDESGPRDQWWKLVYAPQEESPVTIEKTDGESVSIAAGSESKHPILIYASEIAINTTPVQLSDALRTFVRADNKVFQNELSQEQSRLENVTEDDTQGIELLPLTADNVKTVAPESWTSPSKRKHSDSSSVATLGSTNSRGMDMTPGSTGPFVNNDNPPPSAWHEEFASPTPRPNKISGLVEDLEKCRTFEQPESPVIGRRDLPDREPQVMGLNTTKSPEMQERAGRPPPFMTNRPVNQASQVASDADSLMDMDMNIDTEHIEG